MERENIKILVIETKDALGSGMGTLLAGKGFQVHSFDTSEAGLDALENAGKAPFALIISSYAMPGIKGDEILSKARTLSSETLRILVADATDLETVANAVNMAQIHACLTLPMDDHDLINQVENCCQRYQTALKLKNLNQVTQRQNKQLFQIASLFKKRETADLAQIEDRKKMIRILELKIKAAQGTSITGKRPSLKEILETTGQELSAQGLGTRFLQMKNQIKQILETAAVAKPLQINPLDYQEILYRASQKKEPPFLIQTLLASLMPAIHMLLYQSHGAGMDLLGNDFKQNLDDHFQLTFSPDRTKAFIQIKKMEPKIQTLLCIKSFLTLHHITFGIQEDRAIHSWLSSVSETSKPFAIALGREPVPPQDAVITFHFPTHYLQAGRVNEDNSINFKDRGEIPFMTANTLLAAKRLPQPGQSGIDVSGHEIPVREPVDMVFEAGPGTRFSEDGNKIYALIDGQPHLDVMGKISICPELKIKGDLGFETGDIVFDGNVVVEGTVKSGFKVKGASLTAREVQGAQIELTGDLNVSLGIVNAQLVNVKGSIQAKYIHNSTINAFGDLIVQQEIMDSAIRLSGACINTKGVIIASEISANRGIEAGTVGTENSRPPKLQVGTDGHTHFLITRVETNIKDHSQAIALLERQILELEKEDFTLHGEIARYAHVQDRTQLDLKALHNKLESAKASGDQGAFKQLSLEAEQLKLNATQAEENINIKFERQDAIALEIPVKQDGISQLEYLNQGLAHEKKCLQEFTARTPPLARVKIGKKILAGTQVAGPHASLILRKPQGRCQIVEVAKSTEEPFAIWEMKIMEY